MCYPIYYVQQKVITYYYTYTISQLSFSSSCSFISSSIFFPYSSYLFKAFKHSTYTHRKVALDQNGINVILTHEIWGSRWVGICLFRKSTKIYINSCNINSTHLWSELYVFSNPTLASVCFFTGLHADIFYSFAVDTTPGDLKSFFFVFERCLSFDSSNPL